MQGVLRNSAKAEAKQRRGKLSPQVRTELRRLRRDDPLGALDDDDEVTAEGAVS